MRNYRIIALFVVAFLAVFIAVEGAPQDQHRMLSDVQIRELIEHQLADNKVPSGGLRVAVEHRAVMLTGSVPSLWARDRAEAVAIDAPDVVSVVNNLEITPSGSDAGIAEQVNDRIRRYSLYSLFDYVETSVAGGVVTLHGKVTMPIKAKEIGKIASRVVGVRGLENRIEVLPLSSFDDQLRYTIASRIYNDPTFFDSSFVPDPPIHIIVEHSRVTLVGVVRSETDRVKAFHIARSTPGALTVTNELRTPR